MEKEFEEIIKKNLPAQVSEMLAKELSALPTLRAELEEIAGKLCRALEENLGLKKYRDLVQSVEGREAVLSNERQKFEIEKRDERIKMLESKYQDTLKLMDSVFRNQRLVYNTHGSKQFPVKDQYGNTYNQSSPEDSTTERSEQ